MSIWKVAQPNGGSGHLSGKGRRGTRGRGSTKTIPNPSKSVLCGHEHRVLPSHPPIPMNPQERRRGDLVHHLYLILVPFGSDQDTVKRFEGEGRQSTRTPTDMICETWCHYDGFIVSRWTRTGSLRVSLHGRLVSPPYGVPRGSSSGGFSRILTSNWSNRIFQSLRKSWMNRLTSTMRATKTRSKSEVGRTGPTEGVEPTHIYLDQSYSRKLRNSLAVAFET